MSNIHYKTSGLIWDLDGTLLNSVWMKEVVLNDVLRRYNLPFPTHQQYLDNSGLRMLETIQVLTGVSGPLLQKVYDDFIHSEEDYYQNPDSLFFDDALILMRRAHQAGIAQIVISNRAHYDDARLGSPRNIIKRSSLAGYVDAVICGDDNEYCKPDPRILAQAEADLGLVRSELLVVGDQHIDIELACNIGAQAVVVSRSESPIGHLDELPTDWESRAQIVNSFRAVSVSKISSQVSATPLLALPVAA